MPPDTPPRFLLYGATGYSGRLVLAEALRAAEAAGWPARCWTLAGRDAAALRALAEPLGLASCAFAADDLPAARQALDGCTVLLNAAGPYRATAEPLTRAAILAGCHVVDLNGEVDVYERLDDQARDAALRQCVIVSAAGQTATASDWLLTHALQRLKGASLGPALGAVRIAMTRLEAFSRGSLQTMQQAVREQVTVVRGDPQAPDVHRLQLRHVPVGQLERQVDFRLRGVPGAALDRGPCTVTAANLVDTLAAKRSCEELGMWPLAITSFLEMPLSWRLAYQGGAWAAPVTVPLSTMLPALTPGRRLWRLAPAGPTPAQRQARRHRVVLQVDGPAHEPLIDWRLDTPDPYDFSARSAVAIAMRLATEITIERGWQTPGAILNDVPLPADANGVVAADGPFRDCRLDRVRDVGAAAPGAAAQGADGAHGAHSASTASTASTAGAPATGAPA